MNVPRRRFLTVGNGIQVVQVNGTSAANSFRLAGPVQAGAFQYLLFQGGAADANDWFLRSQLAPPTPPSGPTGPRHRPRTRLARRHRRPMAPLPHRGQLLFVRPWSAISSRRCSTPIMALASSAPCTSWSATSQASRRRNLHTTTACRAASEGRTSMPTPATAFRPTSARSSRSSARTGRCRAAPIAQARTRARH